MSGETLDGLQFGLVSKVDYLNCRAKVRLDEFDGLETWWLKVPQRHTKATKSRPLMPEIGEQVAVLLQRDGVNGVVLGGIYSTAEPAPVTDEHTEFVRFSDGTTASYNRQAHLLAVNCVGAISLQASQSVTVQAPAVTLDTPQTTLKGNLQVNGDVNATGKVMDAGGNSNHHSH
ncbi:phage baseplate assembly protein V [Pseudomonas aeruginosa]|uniref:phage baseplate assembly protein V n=1 Tax=Pseudomonas aeruginosa TaxID=287 RepID=UPI00300160EC